MLVLLSNLKKFFIILCLIASIRTFSQTPISKKAEFYTVCEAFLSSMMRATKWINRCLWTSSRTTSIEDSSSRAVSSILPKERNSIYPPQKLMRQLTLNFSALWSNPKMQLILVNSRIFIPILSACKSLARQIAGRSEELCVHMSTVSTTFPRTKTFSCSRSLSENNST